MSVRMEGVYENTLLIAQSFSFSAAWPRLPADNVLPRDALFTAGPAEIRGS